MIRTSKYMNKTLRLTALVAVMALAWAEAVASDDAYATGTRQTELVAGKRYFIYNAHSERHHFLHGSATGISTPYNDHPADFSTNDEGFLWVLEESGTKGQYLLRNVATGTYFAKGTLTNTGNKVRFYNATESGNSLSTSASIILDNGSVGAWKGRHDIWSIREYNGATDGKVWFNCNNGNDVNRFAYWTDAHPIAVYDVEETSFADKVKTDIEPWVKSAGQLFGLTDEAMERLQWDETLTTDCSHERYEAMLAVVSDPRSIYCPTGFYRLTSSRGGALYLDTETPRTETQDGKTTARADMASSVVHLQRLSDGAFYIGMQGRYLQAPARDVAVRTGEQPVRFLAVPRWPGGKVAFTSGLSDYAALHCGYSRVIGYSLTDDASFWTVTPATSLTVDGAVTAADRTTRYATFYAPFATAATEGVSAYTVQGVGTSAVGIPLAERSIPAATPVLLTSQGKIALTIDEAEGDVIEVADDDVPLDTVSPNAVADSAYYYFNKAFLLRGGYSDDGTTYYRTNLSTSKWLYFWQQALVILAVEDRYDFRPDPATRGLIAELLDAFSRHESSSTTNRNNPFSVRAANEQLSDWTWNEYNDDLLWAGLAFIRGYLITGEERFLKQAVWTWDFLYTRGWDDALGGGIWWSIEKKEKSGLSNNPAICMASYLYDATADEPYLDKAKAIYAWVVSHLRATNGAIDEKINADGTLPKSYNVYNQGTFIEGAAALYRLTGDAAYRDDALRVLDYVMVNRVDSKGILSAWKVDGTWQSEFARGVAFLLDADPTLWESSRRYTTTRKSTTLYRWLRLNADAAWQTRDRGLNLTGCQWTTVTPPVPSEGSTWESDACVSAIVMTQVVPPTVEAARALPAGRVSHRPYAPSMSSGGEPTADPSTLLTGTYLTLTNQTGIAVLRKLTDGMAFSPQSGKATVKANSAYVQGTSTWPIDLDATAVAPPTADVPAADARWTDLQGRVLPAIPTAPGIYLHGGKKEIIK